MGQSDTPRIKQRMFFRWDGSRWVLRDASSLPPHRQTRRQEAKNLLMPIVRMQVIEAANQTCGYCGQSGSDKHGPDGRKWHIDHRIPLSRGGSIELDNCVLACEWCNLSKGERTPEEWAAQRCAKSGH